MKEYVLFLESAVPAHIDTACSEKMTDKQNIPLLLVSEPRTFQPPGSGTSRAHSQLTWLLEKQALTVAILRCVTSFAILGPSWVTAWNASAWAKA